MYLRATKMTWEAGRSTAALRTAKQKTPQAGSEDSVKLGKWPSFAFELSFQRLTVIVSGTGNFEAIRRQRGIFAGGPGDANAVAQFAASFLPSGQVSDLTLLSFELFHLLTRIIYIFKTLT